MSPDCVDGLESFHPQDSRSFSLFVELEVGPSDGPGADLFSVTVTTADQLSPSSSGGTSFRLLRHVLVVDEWNVDTVPGVLRDLCQRTSGADWHDVATRLARYLAWEYEDYCVVD